MKEKLYYSTADIAVMLDISRGKFYKILWEMNGELVSIGFLTIAGKIPVAYFKEKWYGAAKEVNVWVVMQRKIQTVCGRSIRIVHISWSCQKRWRNIWRGCRDSL